MTSTIIRRVLVAVLLPVHVPDQIKFGQTISAGLANNPNFPLPNQSITTFNDALTKYDAAETAAQTRAKGTVAVRNAAKVVWVSALHVIKAMVQQKADADPENAEAIITSVGFAVKKVTTRQKQAFAATYGATSGTALVSAKAVARRASYEWQYSVDGGKTWVDVANTLKAKTTIAGLPVAVVVEFRYRATTTAGMGDWSAPTSLLIK
jgi:hypothetical protein